MNIDLARRVIAERNRAHYAPALEEIGKSGALGDLQSVLPLMKVADGIVQQAAISTAIRLIRENLIVHFSELNPEVRQKLGALMESLHPRIVSEISKDIYSDNDQRRVRAVQILGLLRKNPKVKDILADLVKDRDQRIRATAVNLLGAVIGPNDHAIILALLSDKDKRVRANTIEALESLGNKRMIPILQRFRKDPNNRIRGNVLKALYTLGFTEIVNDLTDMLASPDNFMKASALWVISQIEFSTPALEDLAGACLISDNAMVLDNAQKALKAIQTPHAEGYLRYLGDIARLEPIVS
jgi:hypothetical protein